MALLSRQFAACRGASSTSTSSTSRRPTPPATECDSFVVCISRDNSRKVRGLSSGCPIFILTFYIFRGQRCYRTIVPTLREFGFTRVKRSLVNLRRLRVQGRGKTFGDLFGSERRGHKFLSRLAHVVSADSFILVDYIVSGTYLRRGRNPIRGPCRITLNFYLRTLCRFLQRGDRRDTLARIVFRHQKGERSERLTLRFHRLYYNSGQVNVSLPFRLIFTAGRTGSANLRFTSLITEPVNVDILEPKRGGQTFSILGHGFCYHNNHDGTKRSFRS